MNVINVGLVGFGLSGRYLQAPFFETIPDFHLKTVATSQPSLFEVYPHVARAKSLEDILSDPEIDLVSLCTPNETHFDYAVKSLEAGKHVLVEKPFTSTVGEAKKLVALAKKTGKQLFVFQNRRFDSDFMTLQKVVQNGWLGDPLRLEIRFDRHKPILNPKKWKETPGPGSGILYDLGSHIIDQAITLFGKPSSVWGEVYTQRKHSDIDDAFDIRLDYGKLKVQLSSSLLVREPTPRYVLQGRNGSFVKYGLDVQEDHLKAGMLPNQDGFGVESKEFQALLHAEFDGVPFRGHIETATGNWNALFENMADVILRDGKMAIPLEEIVWQLEVIEQVKG